MRIIHGDILTYLKSPRGAAVAHGVNCVNTMGSGVAKAIYNVYPEVKAEYHRFCANVSSRSLLGKVNPVKIERGVVFNCFTQEFYRGYSHYPNSHRFASPLAIECSLTNALTLTRREYGMGSLYVPLIGAGLGGLCLGEVVNAMIRADASVDSCELVLVTREDDLINL